MRIMDEKMDRRKSGRNRKEGGEEEEKGRRK